MSEQQGTSTQPPKVFISYSHQDEHWKDRLKLQLAVLGMEGLLSVWDDRQITEGDDWYPEIKAALNSCDVAILLITANFLTSGFIRKEEIPALLKRRKEEGIRVIPVIVKPCPWQKVDWLSAMQGGVRDNKELSGMSEHDQDVTLSNLANQVHNLLQTPAPALKPACPSEAYIISNELPDTEGRFVGRKAELQMLDDALASSNTKIIQFIAAGGTGKTRLLRHWLDQKGKAGSIHNRVIWSFYAQGTTNIKQVSANPMFEAVFKAFGIDSGQLDTDEKRADAFVHAVIQHQCLLILDGLEPMQHSQTNMSGKLKDRSIARVLKRLLDQHTSLCVITSRLPVYELDSQIDTGLVVNHDLSNLETNDGIQLLRAYQLQGRDSQLKALVEKVKGHALTTKPVSI